MTVIDSKLASVPIGYIINVMEIMLQNWEDILNQSKRFLSYFVRLMPFAVRLAL